MQSTKPASRPPYPPRNGHGAAHALLAHLINCDVKECEKFHRALLAEVRRLRDAQVSN